MVKPKNAKHRGWTHSKVGNLPCAWCVNPRVRNDLGLCRTCLNPDAPRSKRRGTKMYLPKVQHDGTVIIRLASSNSGAVISVIVDRAGIDEVRALGCCKRWKAEFSSWTTYAVGARASEDAPDVRGIYMHRAIASHYLTDDGVIPPNLTVDHLNGHGWDNRLENLRLATDAEQAANRRNPRRLKPMSKYNGVQPERDGFLATLTVGEGRYEWRDYMIGWFQTEESAARAHDLAGLAEFGRGWDRFNINQYPNLGDYLDGASWWQQTLPT